MTGYRRAPVWVELAQTLLWACAVIAVIAGVVELAGDQGRVGSIFLAGFVVLAVLNSYVRQHYSTRIRYRDTRRVRRAIREDTPPAPDDYDLAARIVALRAFIRPWAWLIIVGFLVLAIVSALTIADDPNRDWRSLGAILILLLFSCWRRGRAQRALDWADRYLDVVPNQTTGERSNDL